MQEETERAFAAGGRGKGRKSTWSLYSHKKRTRISKKTASARHSIWRFILTRIDRPNPIAITFKQIKMRGSSTVLALDKFTFIFRVPLSLGHTHTQFLSRCPSSLCFKSPTSSVATEISLSDSHAPVVKVQRGTNGLPFSICHCVSHVSVATATSGRLLAHPL